MRNAPNIPTSPDVAAPWWAGEDGVRLSSVPQHIPTRPDGQPVSAATAFRYGLHGVGGIRLRRFRVGGVWCTTKQELMRWCVALTAAAERQAVAS